MEGLDFPSGDFTTARFRPVAMLGSGSMGVVYRVHDTETDTEVALKTLHRRAPEEILTLKQEFRSLADITHRNLIELYELFVDERVCFFTMEYVDGIDAVSAVRQGTPTGEALRPEQIAHLIELARQLATGLMTVHHAGKLHRDVKPSNIHVDHTGRLVLMDFGLAVALHPEGVNDSSSSGGGSLAYMAPEQAWGKAPHPSADWYSMGVVLYEALTSSLPFGGPPARMFQAKSRGQFEPLTKSARWTPPFLAELVSALLEVDPLRRPLGEDVIRALAAGVPAQQIRTAGSHQEPSGRSSFVGRRQELEVLHNAAAMVKQREPAAVQIRGVSGIGKSELVRHFFAALEDPNALVLYGRCHPQETVPYKGVDPILDELSRYLVSQRNEHIEPLIPDNAGALTKLFPVLGRVPAFGSASVDGSLTPAQLRRRGFLALRQLLARLAEQRFLAIWIDDLQWSDADSALLLRELLRPPDVPPVLLLLSYRENERDNIPLFKLLHEDHLDLPNSREIALQPLAPAESEELLRLLCGDRIAELSQSRAAQESGGSPFFLAQLALHFSSPTDAGAAKPLSLNEVVEARMESLSTDARGLLETISIAGRPVPRKVALDATGFTERQRPLVLQLERAHFVRSTAVDGETAVEAYHDRIRETVLAGLPPERTRQRHLGMAQALRHLPEPDPQQLFVHYLGGEDRINARQFGEEAANRAGQALAFDRSVDLYRQVIALHDEDEPRVRLMGNLAEQLGYAGRGVESARTFEDAAAILSERTGSEPMIIGIKSKAAEQYIRGGRLQQGVASLRPLLSSLGAELPTSRAATVAKVVQQRWRMWRRGRAYELRPPEEIPPPLLQRLDAFWGCSQPIAAMDPMLADILSMRHMIDSLDSGDAYHILRAFAHDAVTCAQFNGRIMRRRVENLLQETSALAERTGDPLHHTIFLSVKGQIHFLRAEWRESHELCEQSVVNLRAQFPWLSFERATLECFGITALSEMGELRAVAERLPDCLADADDRDDLYSAIGYRAGLLNLVWLARDDVAEARSQVEAVLSRWPDEGFHVQHYLGLIARVHAALYDEDSSLAWKTIEAIWPRVRQSGWLGLDGPGTTLDYLRAKTALAAAGAAAHRDTEWQALLREARRHARSLERRRLKSDRPLATLVRASLARAENEAEAAKLYESAADALERVEMRLHAAAARYRAGELRGGDEGAAMVRAAQEWMRGQNIVRPERMVNVFAP